MNTFSVASSGARARARASAAQPASGAVLACPFCPLFDYLRARWGPFRARRSVGLSPAGPVALARRRQVDAPMRL